LRLPGRSAVQRASNINTISRRIVASVVKSPQLDEGDIADEGALLIIIGNGDIAGNAIVLRLDP